MELFPASDDDQWTLVKRVIDDCDYYLVITAGRYGSTDKQGISFTEKEYNYAVQQRKPVVGFVHEDVGKLPSNHCESEPDKRDKLQAFHEIIKKKVVKFWSTPDGLAGAVSRSMNSLMTTHPAEGWIKARFASDPESMLKLRTRIEQLEASLEAARTQAPVGIERLSQGEDKISLGLRFRKDDNQEYHVDVSETWNSIFASLGPHMFDEATESNLIEKLSLHLVHKYVPKGKRRYRQEQEVDQSDFQRVKVQLIALGLIGKSERKRGVHDKGTYWSLTPYGETHLMRLLAIQRHEQEDQFNRMDK